MFSGTPPPLRAYRRSVRHTYTLYVRTYVTNNANKKWIGGSTTEWNVREAPRSSARRVAVIKAGKPFSVVAKTVDIEKNEWLQVDLDGRVRGWVLNGRTKNGDRVLRPVVTNGYRPPARATAPFQSSLDDIPPGPPPSLKRATSDAERSVIAMFGRLRTLQQNLERIQDEQRTIEQCRDPRSRHRRRLVFKFQRKTETMIHLAKEIERLQQNLRMYGIDDTNERVVEKRLMKESNATVPPTTTTTADSNDDEDDDDEGDDIDNVGMGPALLRRQRSVSHKDFRNPTTTTCWLSSCFQALWHSSVFSHMYRKHVATISKLYPERTTTGALQRTWASYEAYDPATTVSPSSPSPTKRVEAAARGPLTPVQKALLATRRRTPRPGSGTPLRRHSTRKGVTPKFLVKRFGRGYGDSLAVVVAIQNAQTSDGEAEGLERIGRTIRLVPCETTNGRVPNLAHIWSTVEKMKCTDAPILYVPLDINARSRTFAAYDAVMSFQPAGSHDAPELGRSHRLCAMLCFLPLRWEKKRNGSEETLGHWVVFCARKTARGRWLLFNDLPGLEGVEGLNLRRDNKPVDLKDWEAVATTCEKHGFRPRGLIFESMECLKKLPENDNK